jgi:3-hydroxyacyl-CoA dehydrogenase
MWSASISSRGNIMKLLEVVRGAERPLPDVLVHRHALAKKIRKVAVVAGVLLRLHRQPQC